MVTVNEAKEKFGELIEAQKSRVAEMRAQGDFVDYSKLDQIVIGICGGDGIGPTITHEAERVLRFLLKKDVESGRIVFKEIDGLTIENRAAHMKAIPDDVLAELKACHVILKGPTTTPRAGDEWPNIESANVAMRKELDLFANVRPVKVPEQGIDWTFFRENTEGAYTLGSCGFETEDGISIDFTVTTTDGTERIAALAYDFAHKNHKNRVSIVTKANIVKATDGKFLRLCQEIGKKYPDITTDDWYIDIMTDEAAEFQGGVGTAGSGNIGKRYAMFEAIHGSAPRMVKEGRAKYADPCSMLRASAMLLSHIGYQKESDQLTAALDKCMFEEKALTITGRDTGCTCEEFGDYVMRTIENL